MSPDIFLACTLLIALTATLLLCIFDDDDRPLL